IEAAADAMLPAWERGRWLERVDEATHDYPAEEHRRLLRDFIAHAPAVIAWAWALELRSRAFATAVWAPAPASDRAFRLLRWMTGKPEPAAPEPVSTAPAAPAASAAPARRGAGLSAPTRDRSMR
ncbi:hypothetical protein ACFXPJ_26995, partial [Streptomyces goshikiensis]